MTYDLLQLPTGATLSSPGLDRLLQRMGLQHELNATREQGGRHHYPPRPASVLLVAVREGRFDDLSPVEWLTVVSAEAYWKREPLKVVRATAAAVWAAADRVPFLARVLLQRAVLALTRPEALAAPLRGTLPHAPLIANAEHPAASAVRSLYAGEVAAPGRHAMRDGVSLREHFQSCGLPLPKALDQRILVALCEEENLDAAWLAARLEAAPADLQLAMVEPLAQRRYVHALLPNSPLRQALVRVFPRHAERWDHLPEKVRALLSDWLGEAVYENFERIVQAVLEPAVADKLGISDGERNQLQKRRMFWKAFQRAFRRLRILLPQQTRAAIGTIGGDSAVGLLQRDGSEQTEVCVFVFERFIVVELFRGWPGEARVFRRTPSLEEWLMNRQVSLGAIRRLPVEQILDHCFLWQIEASVALERLGIPVDTSGRRHRRPTPEDLNERKKKLRMWQNKHRHILWPDGPPSSSERRP